MKTKTIRYVVNFKAPPKVIYEMLMDSRKHTNFTQHMAKISRRVGGKFTAFGGAIEGKNLELKKDKKIVQAWREKRWPKGHYSKVTFSLSKSKTGTRLRFTHTGVPADCYKQIKQGWKKYYWQPMKEALKRRR